MLTSQGCATQLPLDTLSSAKSPLRDNFPLTCFTYLVRRFVMSPRFCLVCFKEAEYTSLKPYVCQSELCLFQLVSEGALMNEVCGLVADEVLVAADEP